MNKELPFQPMDPKDFRAFGLSEFYDESFNFSRFEDFPETHRAIPVSEVRLFNIQNKAKENYARFISKLDYLESI